MLRHFRPLLARDHNEPHRAATELELLFDLVSVIAIAAAAHGLRHEVGAGHIAGGVIKFGLAFFCVWWPWNLFTWFASSFDNNDPGYRLNTMLIMFGALFVAASMPGFFHDDHLVFTFIGYVIMRFGFGLLWLRAGRANPAYRKTASRYALGQLLLQVLWGVLVFTTTPGTALWMALFTLGIVGELAVPWWAEKAKNTAWHRHHIIERFGLLNIIVLGEILLGSANALQEGFKGGFGGASAGTELLVVALCGTIMALCLWWLYFSEGDHLETREFRRVFIWGYGHVVVFAAGAAAGAGLGILVDALAGSGHHGDAAAHANLAHLPRSASLAISLPVGLYVAGLWLVRDRFHLHAPHAWTLLGSSAAIAASGLLPWAPLPTTVLLVACLLLRLRARKLDL